MFHWRAAILKLGYIKVVMALELNSSSHCYDRNNLNYFMLKDFLAFEVEGPFTYG